MSRRGWFLFTLMAVIWGLPYLLIKVAVDDLSPAVVVSGRTLLATFLLAPIAIHQGALRPVLAHWRYLLAFTTLEMAIPWLLLTNAEQHLPSGLTGLLVATVPLFGAATAFFLGDRSVLDPRRIGGLVLGMVGVGLLVGFGGEGGTIDLRSVFQVLLVAVCYAVAPFIASRHLSSVPTLGVVTASVGLVAVAYLPAGIALRPDTMPPADTIWAVIGLAVICTAIAFIIFFALIDEVGPARATLITFANPAVALTLGVVVLNESLTLGLVLGFPVVLGGCWLASGHDKPVEGAGLEDDVEPPAVARVDPVATSTLALTMSVLAVPVIVAVFWAVHRNRSAVLAAVAAGATAALLGVVQLIAISRNGGDSWDDMTALYLGVVITVPAVAAVILLGQLLHRRLGLRPIGWLVTAVAIVAVLVLVPLGLYMSRVEPYAISVQRVSVTVPAERAGDDVVRIGVVSDLQAVRIGAYEHEAIDLLQATEPDIVLVAGDLFQGTDNQFRAGRADLRDLFADLDAPGGVFVVPGDTDDPEALRRVFDGTPVTVLENEVTQVAVGDRTIRLAGLELHPGAIESATVDELVAAPPEQITILLGHRPDWVFHVPDGAADLVVSGHTHGGQIQVPLLGPIMTLSKVPRSVAAGGMHRVVGTPIYVTRGVGREQQGAPQIRFLAPPNVGLITLR